MIEVKSDGQDTDGAIVEVKAISFKGLKEGSSSSSSKDRRRNLTEKEENEEDEVWEEDEQMNRELNEEELLRGRYVDDVGEEETSEEDILREAAQMPFEEDSLEDDKEYTSHPFTKELQEEMLKDFREE